MARPTKIEGNPLHPSVPEIMGGANERFSDDRARIRYGVSAAFAQASVLGLYDPERSRVVKYLGRIHKWNDLVIALQARLEPLRENGGQGLYILTESIVSPTAVAQMDLLRKALPQAEWVQWEPLNRDYEILGSRMAFGEDLQPLRSLEEAEIILSLDADFLACGGATSLEDAHAFAAKRQVAGAAHEGMNRLYVVETAYTLTGSAADHRLAALPHQVEEFAQRLAIELGLNVQPSGSEPDEKIARWARVVAADLQRVREEGRASLLLAGRWQPPAVHALVHWMNQELENVGRSVSYIPPVGQSTPQTPELETLARAMHNDEVDTLLILGGNPVYTAPADLDFAEGLAQVPFSVHLSLYEDETSARCRWHVPQTHFLESWSDAQAANGTVSIVQPLIAPLYAGRSIHELLALTAGADVTSPYQVVRDYWRAEWEQQRTAQTEFDYWWKQVLHDGVMDGTAHEPVQPTIRSELASELVSEPGAAAADGDEAVVAVFRPDPSVWDGRFANNAWLQELPRPFTKITWDNAALVSPATAARLELEIGDIVEVAAGERTIRLPVWVLPGQVDGVVELHVGYGRTRVGEVGRGVGTSVYPLRTTEALWFAPVALRKTGQTYEFATTQEHHLMEDRHLVRHGSLEEYREHPEHPPFVHPPHSHPPEPAETLYPIPDYDGYKWGMSIDLTKCIGCNGCVVACQAENNIPVVGKDQVAVGREMHWLRIDHYYAEPPEKHYPESFEEVESYHQPMLCQHCEYAPCEVVCPVYATTHSSEGLNEMTYNRCVGTRYCSNNCPYKVRRFNYFDYNAPLRENPILQLLPNPDVTVRSRGVMEKCTFCVQRINAARIHAEKHDRPIRDGEVITACQAACPTEAIVFGDLNDGTSRVHELADSPLGYGVLADLNTRPRITYLAALKNPNPALRGAGEEESHG